MRVLLIANEDAGGGRRQADVASDLRRLGAEDVRAVPVADLAGLGPVAVDRVVVCGGDGSVGVAADRAAAADVPLAVIPAGTANDFARALDLPDDYDAAVRLAVTGRELRRIDLGRIGDRAFVNVASAGLAARAARTARPLKHALGAAAYAVGALWTGLRAEPLRARVRVDGRDRFEGGAWQVIVAVTGAFGGGSSVDAADPADGRLDVAVIPAGPRRRLVRHARGMRSGGIAGQPEVVHDRGSRIEVAVDRPGFNVDGEVLDRASAAFTIQPAALAVVVG